MLLQRQSSSSRTACQQAAAAAVDDDDDDDDDDDGETAVTVVVMVVGAVAGAEVDLRVFAQLPEPSPASSWDRGKHRLTVHHITYMHACTQTYTHPFIHHPPHMHVWCAYPQRLNITKRNSKLRPTLTANLCLAQSSKGSYPGLGDGGLRDQRFLRWPGVLVVRNVRTHAKQGTKFRRWRFIQFCRHEEYCYRFGFLTRFWGSRYLFTVS